MTRYDFDRGCSQLIATWDTRVGGEAAPVADLPAHAEIEPGETNTEAWRLAEDRQDFGEVANHRQCELPNRPSVSSRSPLGSGKGHVTSRE